MANVSITGVQAASTPSASPGTLQPQGRVCIAFDDGPLEWAPIWYRIDDTPNLVAGYDMTRGRRTLVSQTETGTATLYLNDKTGDFDPLNTSGAYYGKLDGRQISFQVWDPTTATWEIHWRGMIDSYSYDISPATNANGEPLVATIQVECVDIFDYLAGYGLTPGLDGVTPVASGLSAGTVYYAPTTGTLDDRIIEILTDCGLSVGWYIVFSGNVHLCLTLYNADESALAALRDCCDADLPFIANMYVDRYGRYVFHGRYSRFKPEYVASTTVGWTFHRWYAGDGTAIALDSSRAQVRVLSYTRGRPDIINAAMAYPPVGSYSNTFTDADIPNQVYVDSTSIAAYGKHAAPPMTDLQLGEISGICDATTNASGTTTALNYAKLLVLNKKDPAITVDTLTVKSLPPNDARASVTWPLITKADISDVINLHVGYPSGSGFSGSTGGTTFFIEGSETRVRPLNDNYDYVERDFNVSPVAWSSDSTGVFG